MSVIDDEEDAFGRLFMKRHRRECACSAIAGVVVCVSVGRLVQSESGGEVDESRRIDVTGRIDSCPPRRHISGEVMLICFGCSISVYCRSR